MKTTPKPLTNKLQVISNQMFPVNEKVKITPKIEIICSLFFFSQPYPCIFF